MTLRILRADSYIYLSIYIKYTIHVKDFVIKND